MSEPFNAANHRIADQLDGFAAMLDLQGARSFAGRAYRRAAAVIRELDVPVAQLVADGRVTRLAGVGPGIAARLEELVETGRIRELEELREEVRPELVGLARHLGISPRRMLDIGRQLDVRTIDDLRRAAAAGRLRTVSGVGPVTERKLVERLADIDDRPRRRIRLDRARALGHAIATALGGTAAGDARRYAPECAELRVVVPTDEPARVLDTFAALEQVVAVTARDTRRAVGLSIEGVPIEVTVSSPASFGTELVRATGSRAYVEALEPLPPAPDEHQVYRRLQVPWAPPELREEPFSSSAPELVVCSDIRGDLHCHTRWSDGRSTVLELATAARDHGYDYVAVCDHTPNVTVVPGLDADGLRRQAEEIAAANELLAPFRVLRGAEVDIRSDGTLDLPDDVLDELEWVQLSLHAGQRESADRITKKVCEAMRHPAVRCLSHPTGRIIGHRPPNALDLERVIELAAERSIALETNGLPDRLDLDGSHIRDAIAAGVRIVASSDAHSVAGLDNMRYAVATARRGWATAGDVLNTGSVTAVLATG